MFSYCQTLVRQHDPDRYLLSLLAPRRHRSALWALFAFNYEIAKTREVVSDTTLGLIRLQWWREAINEIYQGKVPREHYVIQPLAVSVKKYDLPQDLFNTLIYAREFDLEDVPPASFEGLRHYCDFTTTPLSQLALKILGQSEDDRIVKSISQYYALIGTLRAVPYMLAQRHVMLPQDLLNKRDLTAQKICDFNRKTELVDIIKEIVLNQKEFRNDHLCIKSKFIHSMRVLSDEYADKLKQYDFDIFNTAMLVPPQFMALKVWVKSF